MGYKWPPQISERPVPTHFSGNRAYFKDGSNIEVDVIIMCTGNAIAAKTRFTFLIAVSNSYNGFISHLSIHPGLNF